MNKKIIGIFVCTMLILIIFPAVSSMDNRKNTKIVENINTRSLTGADWNEILKLLASDGEADNMFGYSVFYNGDYAVIGAPGDDIGCGSTYVFKRSDTNWTEEAKLVATDGATGDVFGISVSISGDYAVIGAPGDDSWRGSAYVFKRSGTSWTQEAKVVAQDGEDNDQFGRSVSISDDYAIIGALYDDSSRGSAYVFKRSGTSWTQEAKLVASDGEDNDNFGGSVSISGDYAVIGAPGGDLDSGSTYVFKRSGTDWIEEAKLVAPYGYWDEGFGVSVFISDDYTLIGAPGDDSSRGSAYVFKRSGTSWTQEAKLVASDGVYDDFFGVSVFISGDYAVIGAPGDDSSRGSAYVFKRSGTSWTQEAKLVASESAFYDLFGISVSISGDYAIIGAYGDDGDRGSAYVFSEAFPDLECLGSLSWTDVKAGDIVLGSFKVGNIGDPGSELSWEIESYPTWGDWTFIPSSGSGLTPEMGTITVDVEVVVPNEINKEFTGEVKVVNSEDSNDFDLIPVLLKTPRNKATLDSVLLRFLERNPLLEKLLYLKF